MRRKLVAGNWKMNGGLAANAALIADVKAGLAVVGVQADIAVCVPAPYLAQVQAAVAGSALALGAQDVSAHASGAYTGEVSGAMLAEFACKYVIVGHSERRAYHGESDEVVAAKAVAALKSGLTPIVCVGETLAEREAGQTNAVVGRQIDVVLSVLDAADVEKIVVAYEPVWAIGTGKTATPAMAQDVHAMLRARLAAKNAGAAVRVQILYGGSMKPDNARELLAMSDIDGGLIGGAALKAADFLAIVQAAQGN
ncbi:triose-phosphate isomerase [Herbaspirillum sp. RV1423]|uniref:triose-phosphate isomerase n=1 Tax=Herbaspirillum sp. RV1423 TaxID=1443993 RepID=UPI0009DEEF8F|nr:triose-phosphate isomerase [Herbaspirillum sp. RV1423]